MTFAEVCLLTGGWAVSRMHISGWKVSSAVRAALPAEVQPKRWAAFGEAEGDRNKPFGYRICYSRASGPTQPL